MIAREPNRALAGGDGARPGDRSRRAPRRFSVGDRRCGGDSVRRDCDRADESRSCARLSPVAISSFLSLPPVLRYRRRPRAEPAVHNAPALIGNEAVRERHPRPRGRHRSRRQRRPCRRMTCHDDRAHRNGTARVVVDRSAPLETANPRRSARYRGTHNRAAYGVQ